MTLLTVVLLAGCGGAAEDTKAVRQGVIDHLSSRSGIDVDSMDIEVTSVDFQDDQATATVSFRAKGSSDPAAGMQMQYTLARTGNRWVVTNKSGSGGGVHGGAMESPHGGAAPQGAMPPGHPPIGEPDTTDSLE